ncbi:tetratricopeptide repeat protein [Cupriavidus gilardii J11]|uniref:Tetratricopeptide repeat protein n=1 Tax=Cupriavidus gilardii J11 TaxID=936133 RepID=A0A562BDU4_9BURK|nr:C39 family peptidase [Cupriavidus gilardii]TWG83357.1 tetratricopeptide repeat protein [Cupriavidus gilardii J11]
MTQAAPLNLYEHVLHLADHGNSHAAFALLEGLKDDPTAAAQALAARVLRHVGAPRRADAMMMRLWRAQPHDPEAMIGYLRLLISRRGYYRAWAWAEENPLPDHASAEQRAEWLAQNGELASLQRDWKRAAACYADALALAPASPWIWVEYAYGLEREDRYDEAVAAAERALELDTDFRSALQAVAHLYTLTGRDAEARAVLDHASARMQSADLEAQRYTLLAEQGRHEAALDALSRSRRFAPLADKARRAWLDIAEAETLLQLGRLAEAARACRRVEDNPYHAQLAARIDAAIAAGEAPRRVRLHVGFVRQHHQTCAPATLSALSGYWGRAARHLEIAEEICYDGTPSFSERAWAERNGFVVREFTVDWESATRLLDAGVPFTLTTQFAASGHLQAVIGYDTIRRTLLIRDPFQRVFGEFEAEKLFADNRFSGPRGMVLLPPEETGRIDGIPLPDADSWDRYYAVVQALEGHDRATAGAVAQKQAASEPGHWLTVWCQRVLAHYDADMEAVLAHTDTLIDRFGEVAALTLYKSRLLDALGQSPQSLALMQAAVKREPWNAPLLTRLAQLESEDARLLPDVAIHIGRSLRVQPFEADAWRVMANMLWMSGQKPLALRHYRIAASLGEFNEDHAVAYFQACCGTGRVSEGLEFLAGRVQRLGSRSSAPAISYFLQLEAMERGSEGFAMLESAMTRRPEDDALRYFHAERLLAYGEADKACAMLAGARGAVRRVERLRVEAQMARREGRIAQAWQAIALACEQEPLNLGLQRMAVDILVERSGQAAAVAYVRALCERHTTSIGLHELLLQLLPAELLDERHAVIRHVLELNPRHANFQRELALNLAAQRRLDEAWVAGRLAVELAPWAGQGYSVLGYLHQSAGDLDAAAAQYRQALTCSVDLTGAMAELVRIQQGDAGRRAALQFVREQLHVQATQGDAVLTFQELAARSLLDDTLTAELTDLRDARPELWQTWAALGIQHADRQRLEEAAAIVEAAIERFPLTPRLHFEKARNALNRRCVDEAVAALRRTLQLSPAWDWPIRLFADLAMQYPGQLDAALALLDAPQSRTADSADCQVQRARVLWKMDRHADALAQLESTLQRWPSHAQAWAMLAQISSAAGEPARPGALARKLAESRPDNIDVWIRAAEHADTLEAALAALDRADAIDAREPRAYIARIDALGRFGQHGQALAATRRTPWGERTPLSIRRLEPRILWRRDGRDEALAVLRALLAEEPNDFALWQDFGDVCVAMEKFEDAGTAGREMARIDPTHAVGYAFIAHAARKLGRQQAAAEAYRAALARDPSYEFAAMGLADVLLDISTDEARAAIDGLRERFPGAATALRELRLALRGDNPSEAPAPLSVIVRANDNEPVFHEAVKLLSRGVWRLALQQTVQAACAEGEASDAACRFWLQDAFDMARANLIDTLQPYLEADRHHRLKLAVIEAAGEARQVRHVFTLMKRYEVALRADVRCWSAISYVLATAQHYDAVVAWMHDWRRADAPFWTLDNLAVSLRHGDNRQLAHEVCVASYQMEPRGGCAAVWLAEDAAEAGDLDGLSAWLDRLADIEVQGYLRPHVDVLTGYLKSMRTGRVTLFRQAMKRVASLQSVRPPLHRLVGMLRRRWARAGQSGWAKAWRWLSTL